MSTAAYPPDPSHPSFCQICGRAVAREADRLAGNAFHCGLCNEVKLASPASTGFGTASGPPGAEAGAPGAGGGGVPPGAPPFIPFAGSPFPPPPATGPNPGLAALLGLIPGVGAMYNGQYAKGVVHLIVFAILVDLADSHDIFGLFVAGWIFYQAIEAYHTARARRDGTPLPNPFGLNDIGERFGFGKAWPTAQTAAAQPAGASANPAAAPGAGTAGPAAAGAVPPYQGTYQGPPPAASWGAPWESYQQRGPAPGAPYGGYGNPYAPPVPPPFAPGAYAPVDPLPPGFEGHPPVVRNRFPAGAIWLIALGTIFLLNSTGVFHGISFRLPLPLLFLGLGVWIFIRRMTDTGFGLADDGTPAYRVRVFRAARGAVWLILLGVVFFLADYNILPWSRSWPLFLILAGVMTFLERSVYSGMGAAAYGYPGGTYPGTPPVPPAPYPPAESSAKPVPVTETGLSVRSDTEMPDQEGR